jgi:hypothetical protein
MLACIIPLKPIPVKAQERLAVHGAQIQRINFVFELKFRPLCFIFPTAQFLWLKNRHQFTTRARSSRCPSLDSFLRLAFDWI